MISLFVEDLEMYSQSRLDSGICLNDICLILLLFADDMVILGLTPEDLQLSLNTLSEYCIKWDLEVNVVKTKLVVFSKRGNEHWVYNNELLETVDHFNYLYVLHLTTQGILKLI